MSAVDHEAAVAKLLADLGDTADAVADRLRALDIKGRVRDACGCPIAALLATYPDAMFASVGSDRAHVYLPAGKTVRVFTPPPVVKFITRFDEGVYLDLAEVAG